MAARALILLLVAIASALAIGAAMNSPTASGTTLLVGTSVALSLAIGWALLFLRSVSQPLVEMKGVTDRLAEGDLRARVRPRRDDEVGALGRAVDRIADQLDEGLRAAAREQARRDAILDAMIEAVVVTDRDGRIVVSNAAFAQLAGSQGTGRTLIEAVRSPELHEAVRAATDGKKRLESLSITTDRETRVLDATVSPLVAGAGVVVVLNDVTELRRSDRVRRDFVANASHELRTPLTSIKGFAETLEGGAMSEPAIAKRFLHGITENANRLHRLVDDLLELSRAESPEARIELVPVSVADVAAKVLRSLEARARERRIGLALEPEAKGVLAIGDERSLDHVLTNLVENAIKYTPEGGHVWLRAKVEAQHVEVTVRDDGPGIAAQHLPRLFERFYRVDPGRAREQGGTGLGLAIVKHLVHRMRGDVEVDSRVGKGTTFTVRLARAPEGTSRALTPS